MKKKVKITVVEIQGGGKCPLGHKIGDTFIYEGWPISNLCAAQGPLQRGEHTLGKRASL